MATPIEELGLTNSTYNALKRWGISTVEEVQKLSDEELLKLRNFGPVRLKDLHETLEKKGYRKP